MSSNKVNTNRRKVLLSTAGLGVLGSALPSQWSKPLVSAVISPVHADMSTTTTLMPTTVMPTTTLAPAVCPALATDNVQVSVPSGQPAGTCSVSFDIVSSDPATPLEVTSIADNASAAVMINLSAPTGPVTDTGGITVVTLGLSTSCTATGTASILEDVTFTIDATCANGGDPVQLVVSLTDLPGVTLA